jgi:Domain of unknown function (DUF5666)
MMRALSRPPIFLLSVALCLPAAFAQDAPSAGNSGSGNSGAGRGGGQGMANLAGHGVRGTVTAVTGNEITVKTEQGDSYKVETGVNTRFRKEREQAKISDIHAGDIIAAAGDLDEKAKTVGAVVVFVIDKEQYEKAKADFGKTWVAGAVQSINETKIAVKRPDDVVQTIVVDENTSFRKHRDSITLADIKVGDNVSARGALQNGNFVATVLTVGGPGGGQGGGPGDGFGGRNRRPDSQTSPATNPTTPAPQQ